MIIKIRTGSAVTEMTECNGMWRIKTNNAGIPVDKLKIIVEALGGKLND